MDNTREKLIELLGDIYCGDLGIDGCINCKYGCETQCMAKAFADHLIANGVTLDSKWIPVTERLPEEGGRFLVCGSRGGIYTAEFRMYGYFGEYHYWHKLNSKSHYCEPTHWMPLPEAPTE